MIIPESRRHLFLLGSLTALIVIITFVGDVLAWRIALEGFLHWLCLLAPLPPAGPVCSSLGWELVVELLGLLNGIRILRDRRASARGAHGI